MLIQHLLRVAIQGCTLMLGSSGVFFLWASFHIPSFASYAIVFLSAATGLTLADPADVALIPSVAYGVATAGKVLKIPPGSRVLLLEDDHSSPVLEWLSRAPSGGYGVEIVARPGDGDWTAALLEAVARPG